MCLICQNRWLPHSYVDLVASHDFEELVKHHRRLPDGQHQDSLDIIGAEIIVNSDITSPHGNRHV